MWIALSLVMIETSVFKSGFYMKLADAFKFTLFVGVVYLVLSIVSLFEAISIRYYDVVYPDMYGNNLTVLHRDTWRWERNIWATLVATQKVFMALNFYLVKLSISRDLRDPYLYFL